MKVPFTSGIGAGQILNNGLQDPVRIENSNHEAVLVDVT